MAECYTEGEPDQTVAHFCQPRQLQYVTALPLAMPYRRWRCAVAHTTVPVGWLLARVRTTLHCAAVWAAWCIAIVHNLCAAGSVLEAHCALQVLRATWHAL